MSNKKKKHPSQRHNSTARAALLSTPPKQLSEQIPVNNHNYSPASAVCHIELLTLDQACELAGGISPSTLSRLVKAGTLKGKIKLGRTVRYNRETLEHSIVELISN